MSSSQFDPSQDPPGYQRYQRRSDEYRNGIEFFVPMALKSILVAEEMRLAEERKRKEAADDAATAAVRNQFSAPVAATPSAAKGKDDPEKEAQVWRQIATKDKRSARATVFSRSLRHWNSSIH